RPVDHVRSGAAGGDGAAPMRAWREAIAQALGSHVVHGVSGTGALLASFHHLPVNVGGWRLQQAECVAAAAAWQCRARYQRAGRGASNASFLSGVPQGWAVEFSSLEQAEGTWLTTRHGLPLARQR